jgi:tryptophan synthase alpha chain
MSTAPATSSPVEARIRQVGGALVGYLPVGYPDLGTSIEGAITLTQHGVDVLELGLPYSDPVMDGPTIQAATTRALEQGFRLRHAFDAVREITAASDVPVLLMTYWNPVLQFGSDRFAGLLAEAGGAGLITPDLVPDEAGEWLAASDAHGLDRVFLAAPTSSEERLRQATSLSRGFTYVVSTMGTTGAREGVDSAARTLVGRLRQVTDEPLAVGLGISNGDQVAEVLTYADGAIVGSALVSALGDGLERLAEVADGLAAGKRAQPGAAPDAR